MKTDKLIAGQQREICPHCTSKLTSPVKYSMYDSMPNIFECGVVYEYVCANCGIKFISTKDRERLKANLLHRIEKETKNASEEY